MRVFIEFASTDLGILIGDVLDIIRQELAAAIIQDWYRSFDGTFGMPALVSVDTNMSEESRVVPYLPFFWHIHTNIWLLDFTDGIMEEVD